MKTNALNWLVGIAACIGMQSCNGGKTQDDRPADSLQVDTVLADSASAVSPSALADTAMVKEEAELPKAELAEPMIPAGYKKDKAESSADASVYKNGNNTLEVWSVKKGERLHLDETDSKPIKTLDEAFDYRTDLTEFTGDMLDYNTQKKDGNLRYVFGTNGMEQPMAIAVSELSGKFYMITLTFPNGKRDEARQLLLSMVGR